MIRALPRAAAAAAAAVLLAVSAQSASAAPLPAPAAKVVKTSTTALVGPSVTRAGCATPFAPTARDGHLQAYGTVDWSVDAANDLTATATLQGEPDAWYSVRLAQTVVPAGQPVTGPLGDCDEDDRVVQADADGTLTVTRTERIDGYQATFWISGLAEDGETTTTTFRSEKAFTPVRTERVYGTPVVDLSENSVTMTCAYPGLADVRITLPGQRVVLYDNFGASADPGIDCDGTRRTYVTDQDIDPALTPPGTRTVHVEVAPHPDQYDGVGDVGSLLSGDVKVRFVR